jgi:hypothetical protein
MLRNLEDLGTVSSVVQHHRGAARERSLGSLSAHSEGPEARWSHIELRRT